jgi:hypothetical protein
MAEHTTKYFGTIIIDETNDFEYIDVKYKDKKINVSLSGCNKYGDKLKVCLDIMDKYIEINEIAKKAILENFPENETVKYYFECHFDILEKEKIIEIFGGETFEEIDIVKTVEELDYPNLLFGIEKNNEIIFSVDYKVSEEYSGEILCVKMDEKLKVIGFSHES